MNCVYFLSLTILMDIVLPGVCEIYKPLQWSPLNPLFQDQSDRNTSVYRINVYMYSKFNIICPNLANNPVTIIHPLMKERLYENIWNVDKNSFETCVVNYTIPRNSKFFMCDDPLKLKYYNMIFLPLTNIKGVPEFEYGKDHYFIATSNGSKDSLGSTAMGHCKSHNMRFIIHVCRDRDDPSCKVARGPDAHPRTRDNKTATKHPATRHPPTDKKSDATPVASGRESACFISAHEIIWLILVCVLGLLVFVLLLIHVFLCYRRRKNSRAASKAEEKRANLII